MGVNLADAVVRMPQRVPIPETNFFAIAITIQQKAGGNLSEALGNLSRVLRERKKMKGKIGAMSMEAKASAAIIGALPFIVMFLVFITSPDYIKLLFTDRMGHLILVAAGFWMSCGIFVMRKMINFDY
jgi:tight adherence protein B